MGAKRFLGLDGIRGAAAFAVLLGHAGRTFGNFLQVAHYYLAVDLFFVLSGFVVALSYEEKLRDKFGYKNFLRARGRRLLPTFWIGTFFCGVMFFVRIFVDSSIHPTFAFLMPYVISFALTMFLVPDPYPDPCNLYPVAPVSWSLFHEWLVNIAYGVLAYRFSTRLLLVIVAVAYGVLIGTVIFIEPHAGFFGPDDPIRFWGYAPFRTIGAFSAGVLIYRWHKHPSFLNVPSFSQLLPLAVVLVLVTFPYFQPLWITDALIVIIGCPLVVILAVRSDQPAPKVYGFLGALSYPLYASHCGIVLLTRFYMRPSFSSGLLMMAACVAVACTIAWIVDPNARSRSIGAIFSKRIPCRRHHPIGSEESLCGDAHRSL